MVKHQTIIDYVYYWNNNFWIDRWWREKHNISFLSSQHKDSNFVDMLFEWEEDQLYKRLIDETLEKEDIKNEEYIPGEGNWLKEQKIIELSDEEFNKLDTSNFKIKNA